jgi:hypothetical protein
MTQVTAAAVFLDATIALAIVLSGSSHQRSAKMAIRSTSSSSWMHQRMSDA